jgi:hypothetical protein
MVESTPSLEVQVTSTTQVFPDTPSGPATTTPLSIIDSTVSYYSRTAGIWFYDPPSSPESEISSSILQTALSKTLNSYRPWCGRLSYVVPQVNGGHTKRYRRVQVTFNADSDLGVTFITATCRKRLSDFLPSPEARTTTFKAWDGSQLPSAGLLPSVRLALSQSNPQPNDPNFLIQVTKFACGSTAVAITITHGLSDAQGMCTFAKDWASISRALYASTDLPLPSPVFDPRLLDAKAAGNIDAESPDSALVKQARSLPLHRFDWYKKVPNQPWDVPIPPDFDHTTELSPSNPIPWEDWDNNAPTLHRVLHFSPAEIQRIHSLARSNSNSAISKHDALLAHVWKRITIARQLPPSTRVYLNITIGLRLRLSLPQEFLGSPIMSVAIPSITPSTGSKYPPLSEIANLIRSHLELFTPNTIAAHLHDAAFEVSPQRIWQTCLGRKHILQTTWVGAGANDVDFVGSRGPGKEAPKLRYVQPEMGGDGLVLVAESIGEEKGGHWSQNGADVIIYLPRDVMGRLDNDPELWGEEVGV